MSAPDVRILTVRQPWAHAIIHLGKDVENRVRNLAGDYRGPVAIHVAKSLPPFDEHWEAGSRIAEISGYRPLFHDPALFGAIIGVVDLVDVHLCSAWLGCCHKADVLGWSPVDGSDSSDRGWEPRICSPWGDVQEDALHHLSFANPRPLAEPIPYRGALGLRRLPADVAVQVLAGVAS